MSKKKKLLLITGNAHDYTNGLTMYTYVLAEALKSLDPSFGITIIGRRKKLFEPIRKKTDSGVTVLSPFRLWGRHSILIIKWITRIFIRPDIVHVQNEPHSFLNRDVVAPLLSKLNSIKVTTFHELLLEEPSFSYQGGILKHSDYIIANDSVVNSTIKEKFSRAPDLKLWSPSNINPPEKSSVERENHHLLYFGHINELKNFKVLQKSYKIIKERYKNLKLTFIGPFRPDLLPFHQEVKSMFEGPDISFTGALDETELKKHLEAATLMLLPFKDGSSLRRGSLQASWAFGLPAITTPPLVPEEEIRDRENVLLCNCNNEEEWVAAVERLFEDSDLYAKLEQGSRRTFEELSPKNLGEKHLEFYEKILSKDGQDSV